MSETVGAVSVWDHLNKVLEFRYRANLPKVSIILPTYNDAQALSSTLQSVWEQKYPDYELIVIDAGSTDRTLEIVDSFRTDNLRVFSAAHFNRYKMWNQGASLARGRYLSFLYPGASYLWCYSLAYMMNLALQHSEPSIVYSGSMMRSGDGEASILFRRYDDEQLSKGLQPTALASCWFRADTFGLLRGFSEVYPVRGSLDLLCRALHSPGARAVATSRVLTDHTPYSDSQARILQHAFDTWRLVARHYGRQKAIRWLLSQQDLGRLAGLWWRSLRTAFLGR
ncbi:MAG: glycosyltransferase [Chlamydiia bacterium]|nr:glycosyltransferase [Chlamydiia bacterium]